MLVCQFLLSLPFENNKPAISIRAFYYLIEKLKSCGFAFRTGANGGMIFNLYIGSK